MANFWQHFGELLANFWRTFGELLSTGLKLWESKLGAPFLEEKRQKKLQAHWT